MDAFVFPGQGSQYVGMGREWCARSEAARAVFAHADDAGYAAGGVSLSQLCLEGPAEALNDTQNTQPALLTASVAALRALEECTGHRAAYVAGHSLGEFAALVAAEALPFDEALRLVTLRGQLMKRAGEEQPGGMAAVIGLEREELENICATEVAASAEYVGIANDNCPGQVVISGARPALERVLEAAKAHGAKRVVVLAVSVAAHTPLMGAAAATFRRHLAAAPFRTPCVPYVSNTTARPVAEPVALRDVLGRQLTSPVNWTDAVRWMIGQGVTRFVEVGPRDVLLGLVRRIDQSVATCHVDALLAD